MSVPAPAPSLDPPARRRAWLQLIRIPNCFTVIPDPLAGFFLGVAAVVTGGSVADPLSVLPGEELARILVTLGLIGFTAYAGGVAGNDVADRRWDRTDRPERPLVGGGLSLVGGVATVLVFAVLSVLLAATLSGPTLVATGVLLLTITAYNLLHKRLPRLGLPLMGLARVANLGVGYATASLIGLTAENWVGVVGLLPPVLLYFWVLSISVVAKFEGRARWAVRLVPRMILGIAILDALLVLIFLGSWWAAGLVAVWILPAAWLAQRFRMS